ncbi:MAG: hypothetical protein LUE99_03545 [Bacteroides sp.]|nr:hypothetical protein [Bacteroides sp.]
MKDVIAPGLRWTDVLRVIRNCHPEATIILPFEKIQLRAGDDVRSLIAPRVANIRQTLDSGVDEWHGYTPECRIRQVRLALSHYFYFQEGCISNADLDVLLDELIYVKRQ